MNLLNTNLVLTSSPLPEDFEGNPQDLYEAMVARLQIKSAAGTNFFVTGDVAPSTNVGPWLKNGTKWYVFDQNLGTYVPQDISDSTARLFTAGDTEPDAPEEDDAQIWLRTSAGRVIAWYFWNGSLWRPGGNKPPSGPTASRPSGAVDYEQYFDTDINVMLHWERGAWRTISGTPGDVKFVTTSLLADALTKNPGWNYLGDTDQSWIGRTLGIAAKDPGATPAASYSTDSGITARASAETAGAETVILTSAQIEQHTHLVGALTALNSNNDAQFYRVDDADNFLAPTPRPPNYAEIKGDNNTDGTGTGELPAPSAGTMFVTSKQLTLAGAAAYTAVAEEHNNIQPTLFLWALTKA